MDASQITAVFAGMAAIITAIGGVLIIYLKRDVADLKVSTDGRLSELLELSRALALKEGIEQGHREAKEESGVALALAARTASDTKTSAAKKAADVLETAADIAREKLK